MEAARAVFESHKKYSLNKKLLNDLGDEAVSSDLGPPVAFRKGKYTVYISADVDFGAELYARGFNESEIFKREASEGRRLSRGLARHVAAALDAP